MTPINMPPPRSAKLSVSEKKIYRAAITINQVNDYKPHQSIFNRGMHPDILLAAIENPKSTVKLFEVALGFANSINVISNIFQ